MITPTRFTFDLAQQRERDLVRAAERYRRSHPEKGHDQRLGGTIGAGLRATTSLRQLPARWIGRRLVRRAIE